LLIGFGLLRRGRLLLLLGRRRILLLAAAGRRYELVLGPDLDALGLGVVVSSVPAPQPGTRMLVFSVTEGSTFAPADSAAFVASTRVIVKVPVNTIVFPDRLMAACVRARLWPLRAAARKRARAENAP
jgi:hypothetical protein